MRNYMSQHGNKDGDNDVFLPHLTHLLIQEAVDSFAYLDNEEQNGDEITYKSISCC